MSVASAENLGLAYGSHVIFERIGFTVAAGDRVGLVGANGSGKSSLLRLIAGIERPTSGSTGQARTTRIAYVPQRPELDGSKTVYQEVSEVFAPLRQLEDELLLAGEALGAGADESAARRYEELSQRFEHEGGYTYEAEIRRTLQGLGVTIDQWQQPTGSLSGGEQARVALAKAVLGRPDLLLLDEPTNHLDLQGLSWIEGLLAGWTGAFIVVSHDRYFLDQTVNRIWALASQRLTPFRGNYMAYAAQRDERFQREQRMFEEQRREIARQEELIRRYGAGQRAKWAKGLEKRLGHVERLTTPKEAAALRLEIDSASRSGQVALALDQLRLPRPGGGDTLLSLPSRLQIERGTRVAVLGPNGSGKTTLLRTIVRELAPSHGTVTVGHGVQLAFHRQGMEDLHDDAIVFDELMAAGSLTAQAARDLLARFLFRGDDVQKRVGVLSGGERSRLALAKLAISGANLLLLDEPTNHLDIPAREALEEVLLAYNGSVLCVSHDRRFIDAIATRLWVIEDGALRELDGNFSDYAASQTAANAQKSVPPRAQRLRTARPKKQSILVAEHERTVADLDARLVELRAKLDEASGAEDALEVARLGQLYVETETALDAAVAAWDLAESGDAGRHAVANGSR